MKESPHELLTAEQDKRETIHCAMWASVVVLGMLALLLHGLAFFSWTEMTNEDIYARRSMQNQIEDLSKRWTWMIAEYKNHTHIYSTGKPATAR